MSSPLAASALSLSPTFLYECAETSGVTAIDASGNGNNGYYTNNGFGVLSGVTLNQPGPSAGNPSVLLSGGYLNSGYSPTNTSALTVMLFAKIPSFIGGQCLASAFSGNSGFIFNLSGASGALESQFGSGGGFNRFNSDGTTRSAGTWYLYVVTLSSKTATVYVNGSVISGAGGTFSSSYAALGQLVFGAQSGNFGNALAGSIGCCAFWDGTALSSADITALAAAFTNPVTASPASLVFALGGPAQTTTISGGTTPYSEGTSNAAIATASQSGATTTITPGSTLGSATITITDSTTTIAQELGIPVTVVPLVLSSSSLSFTTASPQTVNVSGGMTPYSVGSNNATVATASVSGGTVTVTSGTSNGTATITVTDSTSPTPRSVTIAVTVTIPLAVSQPTLSFTTTTPQTSLISGGIPPYSIESVSPDKASGGLSGSTVTVTPGVANGSGVVNVFDSSVPVLSTTITSSVNISSNGNAPFTLNRVGPSAGNASVQFPAGGYVVTQFFPQSPTAFALEGYFKSAVDVANFAELLLGITPFDLPYSFSANTWYHVIMVYLNGLVTLYVNGASAVTQRVSNYIPGQIPVCFGTDSSEDFFLGGVACYDGNPPSAGRIAAHYAALL